MAELVNWPEMERLDNPLDPDAASVAPVEIRFQVKLGPQEQQVADMGAECSVAGRPAPSPGAVMSFREWEKDEVPTLYCYALARGVKEGDKVTLKVHPRDKHHAEKPDVLFEKEFKVRVEGDKYRLE